MADAKVLEAQKWVNATYAGVAGYVATPEDGKTGWSTMFALTRALQYELGIASLSSSFGPTTIGKLDERGGIKLDESNKNLVRIVQCACYCKGYEPGGINGNFGLPTQFAVTSLMSNAGLGDQLRGTVSSKVMKALLTMDAYVVVAGGTDPVRSIQQWLNGRYVASRKNFFVIPCDGIFSRDVQKALYLAIQYELGMTDDQATGAFGPGTQAGLKAHTLAEGASGIFVNIFSAAMVFNRVRLSQGGFYGGFTGSFGAELTSAVKSFQKFSELPETGSADFATWCQLLVSTGDPTRPGAGCDCITTITDARAQTLRAAGYRFVGRYLDEKPGGKLNKRIQPGELDTIFRNGLRVFPISQYYGGEVKYFNYPQGFDDALNAHAAAFGYGFDIGTVIYFGVDYDATQTDIDNNIIPYFRGVVAGLASQGKRYVHGVYGSRNVCTQVTKSTYARWSFVSGMSTGFSGNMGFALPENWSFNQIRTLTVGSGGGAVEIDNDVYKTGSDPAVGSVNNPVAPVDAFIEYVEKLYALATAYAAGGGKRSPNTLVLEFMRHEEYQNTQWQLLIGDLDWDFVDYVDKSGVQMIRQLRDPFYGIDLKVSHLAASINGEYLRGAAGGTAVKRGDVAGWAGDWMTFYGEWRRDSDSYSSGLTYCREKLAKLDGNGTFKLRDLIEDADSYNIAMRMLQNGTIVEEMRFNYLGGGYLSRFKRFFEGRFGSAGGAKAIAREALTSSDDAVIDAGRTYLIESTGGFPTLTPSMLPDGKLDEFCQGFADMLLQRVGDENAKARMLRANSAG
ncbi:DUF1906 domain-containing protein [Kitasatospora sp. NBC_01250]|uniref:glycoside hydrolase domain-containing protein n=1 Tax=unclassified Kitasatospora TaxID=2633591 RepID=UPI002E1399B0|nr:MULTISPECIES: glycoside hydrolase domain-containing protein [unclassified Kitasatospora]WSJ71479.1 DUF1906 domain-containing protein [Kitasatospora sp. NBC_01302]